MKLRPIDKTLRRTFDNLHRYCIQAVMMLQVCPFILEKKMNGIFNSSSIMRRRECMGKNTNHGEKKRFGLWRMQAWSPCCKFRAGIGFKEATHRTTEGTHWNAFLFWYPRNSPKIFFRCSFNPVDNASQALVLPVENEPLHHLAVTLGALHGFRIHAQTS